MGQLCEANASVAHHGVQKHDVRLKRNILEEEEEEFQVQNEEFLEIYEHKCYDVGYEIYKIECIDNHGEEADGHYYKSKDVDI